MKNKILTFGLIIGLIFAGATQAAQISVPSANGRGFLLQSLLNGTYSPVSLTAGSNITISTSTSNITISATGGSASSTLLADTNTWSGRNVFTFATSTNFGISNLYSIGSGGIDFHSNNGTSIADFGAGGGAGVTFFGGVNIDGATRLATSLTGLLKATSGSVSTASNGTDYTLISGTTCSGTDKVSAVSSSGAITCSTDQAGSGSAAGSSGQVQYNNAGSFAAGTALLTNGTVSGVNATSAAISFNVQGSGSLIPFSVQSSSAKNLFSVLTDGTASSTNINLPISTSSVVGVINKNGNRFIHDYSAVGSDGGNTFGGFNSGNFTMGNPSSATIFGSLNTAFGYESQSLLTTGFRNTSVGYQALKKVTTGSDNTAMGFQALTNLTTGTQNIAIGRYSMFVNSTGNFNVGMGNLSLFSNTSGAENFGLGYSALSSNTTGGQNTGVGTYAIQNNTTGNFNVSMGYNALGYSQTGEGNTAIGSFGGAGTSGNSDTNSRVDTYSSFFGYGASRATNVGSTTALTNATAIGKFARVGCSNCLVLGGTGSDSVKVGIGSTTPIASLSIKGVSGVNPFVISSSTDTQLFTVTPSGYVGISSSTPTFRLSVDGTVALTSITSSTAGNALCRLASGEVVESGGTSCLTSSKKTKDNIIKIDSAISTLLKLNPVQYRNKEKGDIRYGFIAEEVNKIDTKLVEFASKDIKLFDGQIIRKGEPLTVDYIRFTAFLTKGFQELNEKVDKQQKEIEDLKKIVNELKKNN